MSPLPAASLLLRLLPRLLGQKLALALLPTVSVVIFVSVPLLPVFNWIALREAASAAAPLPGGAAALGTLLTVALVTRKALASVIYGPDLQFLHRMPAPDLAWGPALALLTWETMGLGVIASWFWETPWPLCQAALFGGVAAPLAVAVAGPGTRAAGLGLVVSALGLPLLALGRAAPGLLPGLGPLALLLGAAATGPVYTTLRLREGGLDPALPGRPGSPAAAWLRWDLTLVLRQDPRALAWALAMGPAGGALVGLWTKNGGVTGPDATDAALVLGALLAPLAALPVVRALDLQGGRLAPTMVPLDAAARARGLVGLALLGLTPLGLGLAVPLISRDLPGLLRLGGAGLALAAGLVALAAGPDARVGHRINLGWVGGLLAAVATVGVALPQASLVLLPLGGLLLVLYAQHRIKSTWGRIPS